MENYKSRDIPLFVDLDGTYTKTDLLFESFVSAFKKKPIVILSCIYWLIKGIPTLKYKLSEYAEINTSLLPLNPEFLSFLKHEKSVGRKLYLATASNEKYAKNIISDTDLFSGYISSCKNINLKGKNKLERIKQLSEKFAYAGNDSVDFEIFEEADEILLVNPSTSTRKKAKKYPKIRVFDVNKTTGKVWIKQLRLHQWLKNLLLFVPIIVSEGFTNFGNVMTIIAGFFAFGLLASSTYVLNDLFDLESDRVHKRKKNRPLAAGSVSIKSSLFVAFSLFITSIVISLLLSYEFSLVLFSYLCLTLFYSFKVKQYVGMDVVTLALLYTIRILAGSAAINVTTSFWLLAFSIFIFLSLALIKRCSEIKSLEAEGKQLAKGRDYSIEDYSILASFGTSSAMLALLMFCFYINNNVLTNQYQQPDILWLIVPALCYWLMRMWIKTHRGEMHDDPIVFSMKDRGSLLTIGFCGFVVLIAQIL